MHPIASAVVLTQKVCMSSKGMLAREEEIILVAIDN